MNIFSFSSPAKRTNNATHYVKLGKKRQENSRRNYYMISPRVIILKSNHHHRPTQELFSCFLKLLSLIL